MKPSFVVLFLLAMLTVCLRPSQARAFNREFHCPITKAALNATGFAPEGLEPIYFANRLVDVNEFYENAAHACNDDLEHVSDRLKQLRQETATAILDQQFGKAQLLLGRALHTIQDFFSHSNFIEMNLGKETESMEIDLLNLQNPADDVVCSVTNNVFTGLSTSYYPDESTPVNRCSHTALSKDTDEKKDLFPATEKKAIAESAKWIKLIESTVESQAADQATGIGRMSAFKAFVKKLASKEGVLGCDELIVLPENNARDLFTEKQPE